MNWTKLKNYFKVDGKKNHLIVFNGGEKGIRTLDTVARIHAFQACAMNLAE